GATIGNRSRCQHRARATAAVARNTLSPPPPTSIRTLPTSGCPIQFRPDADGHQPCPRHGAEDDSALATARRVSRAQAAAPPAAESERVWRLPPTTLERGLPQCIAALSRDSPERLCRKARHGEAIRFRLEKNGEAHIAGGSAEERTQECLHPCDSPSRQDQLQETATF